MAMRISKKLLVPKRVNRTTGGSEPTHRCPQLDHKTGRPSTHSTLPRVERQHAHHR